ncbi:alpha-L-fucosidase [Solihabitans fulvus]|uniref:alpha-L-fucosidase n=1 Tax=Solihabitans fulvus TaxID=1892852 RepID=A0A5B2XC67_9PSEU|nr:alpha-L-fucosidase [Solihabitans fulvus]KAA2260680.1 alpha-L-fucosidase [Solihabitans fulvus]
MTTQAWFADAKLGIFVHWGIYAVDGVTESWSFFNGEVSYADYLKQLDGFTAAKYDAEEWAVLFRKAGARYAVLTAKHHDGVALWDTALNDLSVVRRTPAGRDLIEPYVEALRRHDLKVGLYFSHLDWSHPDYPYRTLQQLNAEPIIEEPEHWERFLRFHRGQLRELVTGYSPDLLWFDGEWELPQPWWRMDEIHADLVAMKPGMVFNGRLLGHGDYATPEQGAPTTPPEGPWELCYTINNSWGFQGQDQDYKPLAFLVQLFVETIGGGGNLLLDVGPREDGTIPSEQAARLEGLGDWIRRNDNAVYGTERGIPAGHFHGPTTVSRDRRTLYVFCFDPPRDHITIRGLKTPVKRITVLGTGETLAHRRVGGFSPVPGMLLIDAPAACDRYVTTLAVELDGELELYRGHGRD